MDKQPYTVTNNQKQQQYEVHEGDEIAILQYRLLQNKIALMHTEVPESLNGRGIAAALAHHALETARSSDQRVMVYCPYVAAYLKRHPEYNDLVVPLAR